MAKNNNEMTLKDYERSIEESLVGKELWGDIDYSLAEYEILRDLLKKSFNTQYFNAQSVFRIYPNCITTFLVFLTRYRYNKYFWRLVSEELEINISQNQEKEIGDAVKKVFDRHGFDYSAVNGEKRVNIAPILYEGGIPPESCLDDLFYILDYDSDATFEPTLLIEDLTSGQSYKIRKPLRDFLQNFKGNRAVEFVLEMHDAVLSVNCHSSVESRFVDSFTTWKEKEKTKESISRRKNREVEVRPHLCFDNKNGLSLVLPKRILDCEYLDDVIWNIQRDDSVYIKKYIRVFGDEGRRYTESITVPISPGEKYRVWLDDNESEEDGTLTKPEEIEFIKPDGIIQFNANGRLISNNYLQYPQSIIIMPENAVVIEQKSLSVSRLYYPTNLDSYQVCAVEPINSDAKLVISVSGVEYQLTAKPRVDMTLNGKTMFALTDINVFTEIPAVTVSMDDYSDTRGYELRVSNERISIADTFVEGESTIDLKKHIKGKQKQYGYYSVRLYRNNHFVKQTEFYYVPKIKSTYSPVLFWPEGNTRYSNQVLNFERSDDYSLEFKDCTVTTDSSKYYVDYAPTKGEVTGILHSEIEKNTFSLEFALPVNPFEFELVNELGEQIDRSSGRIYRLGLNDINESVYWLSMSFFGGFKEYEYTLQLESIDGIEQSVNLNKNKNGQANYNLQVFSDTIRTCPLPATIFLKCESIEEGSYRIPLISISQTVRFINLPYYTPKGYLMFNEKEPETDVTVRRFGMKSEEQTISFDKSVVGKTSSGVVKRGFPCNPKLTPGIYIIESSSKETLSLFEDDHEINITSNNAINVGVKNTSFKSFSEWLDQFLSDIIKSGTVGNIEDTVSYKARHSVESFRCADLSDLDYERLVAAVFILNEKGSRQKREKIRECIRIIATNILDGEKRLQIIRLLLNINCPNYLFESCVKEYGLELASCTNDEAKELADQIERYSPELALYLLMQIDAPLRNTIGRDRFRELIGKEAIRSLISVPGTEDVAVKNEELRKFLREKSPCKVRVTINKEIAGEMEPIQEMIEYKGNYIFFNVKKKPDIGIYFYQIRYVDQYVNWYLNTHSRKTWDLNPSVEALMKETVKEDVFKIVKLFNQIKQTSLKDVAKQYEDTLRGRFQNDPTSSLTAIMPNRYFYLQGLAAFLAKLPKEYGLDDAVEVGEHFMIRAFEIAPKMSRRDLMMASTYIYLTRKEEKICR